MYMDHPKSLMHGSLQLVLVKVYAAGGLYASQNYRMGGKAWYARMNDGTVRHTLSGTRAGAVRLLTLPEEK